MRGFRVELGEVEARLATLDGVAEVAVIARQEARGEKQLVAYYTGARAPDRSSLREQARMVLPEYMVPAVCVQLAKLPLTPNGKVDRNALPAPETDTGGPRPVKEPPRGEVERALARMWRDLLKVETVGRDDNFFALGGHSLLALALIERMRRANLRADVRSLFMAPTLAGSRRRWWGTAAARCRSPTT